LLLLFGASGFVDLAAGNRFVPLKIAALALGFLGVVRLLKTRKRSNRSTDEGDAGV
jgi:hypothetical protein